MAAQGESVPWKGLQGPKRIISEFKYLMKQIQKGNLPMISDLEMVADNTNHWRFKVKNFDEDHPAGKQLNQDLKKLQRRYHQDHLLLEITFPPDYPVHPFFVRLVSPRCRMYSGHVTAGGSICIEALVLTGTDKGWQPDFNVESILSLVFANMLDTDVVYVQTPTGPGGMTGPLRIDVDSHNVMVPYSDHEAKAAYDRVVSNHGWRDLAKQKNARAPQPPYAPQTLHTQLPFAAVPVSLPGPSSFPIPVPSSLAGPSSLPGASVHLAPTFGQFVPTSNWALPPSSAGFTLNNAPQLPQPALQLPGTLPGVAPYGTSARDKLRRATHRPLTGEKRRRHNRYSSSESSDSDAESPNMAPLHQRVAAVRAKRGRTGDSSSQKDDQDAPMVSFPNFVPVGNAAASKPSSRQLDSSSADARGTTTSDSKPQPANKPKQSLHKAADSSSPDSQPDLILKSNLKIKLKLRSSHGAAGLLAGSSAAGASVTLATHPVSAAIPTKPALLNTSAGEEHTATAAQHAGNDASAAAAGAGPSSVAGSDAKPAAGNKAKPAAGKDAKPAAGNGLLSLPGVNTTLAAGAALTNADESVVDLTLDSDSGESPVVKPKKPRATGGGSPSAHALFAPPSPSDSLAAFLDGMFATSPRRNHSPPPLKRSSNHNPSKPLAPPPPPPPTALLQPAPIPAVQPTSVPLPVSVAQPVNLLLPVTLAQPASVAQPAAVVYQPSPGYLVSVVPPAPPAGLVAPAIALAGPSATTSGRSKPDKQGAQPEDVKLDEAVALISSSSDDDVEITGEKGPSKEALEIAALKRQLKQIEKEKRQVEKEKKEKERLLAEAEARKQQAMAPPVDPALAASLPQHWAPFRDSERNTAKFVVLPLPGDKGTGRSSTLERKDFHEIDVVDLVASGLERKDAVAALRKCKGDVVKAALFANECISRGGAASVVANDEALELLAPKSELSKLADEVEGVLSRFEEHSGLRRSQVKRIERVQNWPLWTKFQIRRRDVLQAVGSEHGLNEVLLFHGTGKDTIRAICSEGFDMRVSNRNCALGEGVYFAYNAQYSLSYSQRGDLNSGILNPPWAGGFPGAMGRGGLPVLPPRLLVGNLTSATAQLAAQMGLGPFPGAPPSQVTRSRRATQQATAISAPQTLPLPNFLAPPSAAIPAPPSRSKSGGNKRASSSSQATAADAIAAGASGSGHEFVAQHAMLLARVVLGRVGTGTPGIRKPPQGADSVSQGGSHALLCAERSSIVAVFDNYQAYPEYIIHYDAR